MAVFGSGISKHGTLVEVPQPLVAADSYVMFNFESDPGKTTTSAFVKHIEKIPGVGFNVYLSIYLINTVQYNYLVLSPADLIGGTSYWTLTGDVLTPNGGANSLNVPGTVTASNPTSGGHLTTKSYVDTLVASASAVAGTTPSRYGTLAPGGFTGSPLQSNIVFTPALTSTAYNITVNAEDLRLWTVSNKTLSGCVLHTNSSTPLVSDVKWQAVQTI